jgi:hypothetical protein
MGCSPGVQEVDALHYRAGCAVNGFGIGFVRTATNRLQCETTVRQQIERHAQGSWSVCFASCPFACAGF